jgi:hypothetical protein
VTKQGDQPRRLFVAEGQGLNASLQRTVCAVVALNPHDVPKLTSANALITFRRMSAGEVRQRRQIRRLLSAAIVVFVFFLPLHLHVSLGGQVTKECSCVQGTRTQLAAQTASTSVLPSFRSVFFTVIAEATETGERCRSHNVRAPPDFLSF